MIAGASAVNGDYQRAIEVDESVIQHAMTFDEVAYAASEQIGLAKKLAHVDPTKGLEVIESAAKTIKKLGYFERKTDLFTIMGLLFDARGEYDAAVRSLENGLELREKLHPGLSPRYFPAALSRAFRRMGLVEEALEWAKIGLEAEPILSATPSVGLKVTGNLCVSIALALLGRVEEVKPYYDIGSELVLKSGVELWLSDMYLCRGLIERAEGRITDALVSFEDALDIVGRLKRQGRINECLFLLAETEIQHHFDTRKGDGILALHWIGVMEEMARRKNLPGVLGQALLLKASIQLHQHNNETARATLHQVRELSKNPGTRFLQDKIEVLSSTYNPKRR